MAQALQDIDKNDLAAQKRIKLAQELAPSMVPSLSPWVPSEYSQ